MKKVMSGIILFSFLFLVKINGQKIETNLLNQEYWKIEAEFPDSTFFNWNNKKVKMDSKGGVTLWLNQKLKGHYIIEYDRKINLTDSYFPRISDINQFWNAQLSNDYSFNTNGRFSNYDNFQMMYFGFGGNSNKTTRFRYYNGQGERVLLKEYLDKQHLINSTKIYHIKTEVNKNQTSVWINNVLYFQDSSTKLNSGYFGLRMTWSSQTISNFKITKF
ncbi:DUF6250 domain-containing protein [Rhizosphaericola mali]|uniref:Methyltransferase n=1 Tax=Rhizosphaericola mali TaxID=2545455 RepID=A0A5P2G2U6_9BACT|nr:DUF6250 domain-containing protein [Rhizosphaericola mali]QES88120.1 methyltransferase [Rhizosphaericola mali]